MPKFLIWGDTPMCPGIRPKFFFQKSGHVTPLWRHNGQKLAFFPTFLKRLPWEKYRFVWPAVFTIRKIKGWTFKSFHPFLTYISFSCRNFSAKFNLAKNSENFRSFFANYRKTIENRPIKVGIRLKALVRPYQKNLVFWNWITWHGEINENVL